MTIPRRRTLAITVRMGLLMAISMLFTTGDIGAQSFGFCYSMQDTPLPRGTLYLINQAGIEGLPTACRLGDKVFEWNLESVAMGDSTTASAKAATAFGRKTLAMGPSSTAVGKLSKALQEFTRQQFTPMIESAGVIEKSSVDTFIVNLNEVDGTRYLKVTMVLVR